MSEVKNINTARVDEMFKVGAHYGLSRSKRHASTAPYIFGVKNQSEIIDLEKTDALLDKALAFVTELGKDGKQILFLSGKNEGRDALVLAAESVNMPHVAGRWIGGTLTNFPEIKKRIAKLDDLVKQKERGDLLKYTKKERLMIDREIESLNKLFSGIALLKDLPKALFVVDAKREHIAVEEANKMKIPVVSLCNSDCDIRDVAYPIVANDGSVASVTFFINEIAKAYAKGKNTPKA